MASPELAEKLAKRFVADEQHSFAPPPPAPIIPQKVVENPYVATSETSIDDIIFKALEKKEENNNNQIPLKIETVRNEGNVSSSRPNIDPRSPPPKLSIQELLEKERQIAEAAQQSAPTPKTPVMVISKGAFQRSASPRRQNFVHQNEDGSELEKRLAAQRLKKYAEDLELEKRIDPLDEFMNKSFETLTNRPVHPQILPNIRSKESLEEEDRQRIETEETKVFEELEKEIEKMSQQPAPPPTFTIPPPPPPSFSPPLPPVDVETSSVILKTTPPVSPRPTSQPPPPPTPPPSSSSSSTATTTTTISGEFTEKLTEEAQILETIEEASESSLPPPPLLNETNQSIASPPPPPPPPPPKPETPIAVRRRNLTMSPVPTPQLIQLIQKEDELKSPSTSRPQSPNVQNNSKPIISPLGLQCDPLLSIEKSSTPPPILAKKSMPTMTDEEELSNALERRVKILDGEQVPVRLNKKISLYAEFSEFSRKQIQCFTETFKKYDEDQDNFIDFNELKRMMEKLGEAQTHIALKQLIKKVDEDGDGKISQREFLLLFRFAASGELACSQIFQTLADSVDVSKEGVLGAANFFQAKIEEQSKLSKFEEEMRDEKEQRRRDEEERRARREQFLAKKSIFH